MSSEEFGRLTPRLFAALLDRKQESERAQNLRAGLIAASIYNANPYRKQGSPAIKPEDFFGRRRSSMEEMLAKFSAMAAEHNAAIDVSQQQELMSGS